MVGNQTLSTKDFRSGTYMNLAPGFGTGEEVIRLAPVGLLMRNSLMGGRRFCISGNRFC